MVVVDGFLRVIFILKSVSVLAPPVFPREPTATHYILALAHPRCPKAYVSPLRRR